MKTHLFLPLLTRRSSALVLLMLLVLPACKPSVSSLLREPLVPEAIFQESDDSMNEEARGLIRHYLKTGDARYATSEHRLTMLHLAAMSHRYWLVEKLLAEGADPNAVALGKAHPETGERPAVATPATLAVAVVNTMSNEDALLIVKALMAAGGDINLPLSEGSILSLCQSGPYSDMKADAMALELIKLGARSQKKDIAQLLLHNVWPDSLEYFLNTPDGQEEFRQQARELLIWSAEHFRGKYHELRCAQHLYEHLHEPLTWEPGEHSPLFLLAKNILQNTKEMRDCYADSCASYAALMLNKGEDALRPDGEFRRTCAADVLAASPSVLALLKEKGITITVPAHHFASDTLVEQLLDIPSDAIRNEEVLEQAEVLQSVFTAPTEAMFATNLLYRQASSRALTLLARATPTPSLQELLKQHPAWQKAQASWEGEAHAARALLIALNENPQFNMPADWLLESARQMDEAGRPDVAHAWRLLLAHNEDNEALIDSLCDLERTRGIPLPIRAAALSCKLKQNGLPTLYTLSSCLNEQRNDHVPAILLAMHATHKPCIVSKLDPLLMPERLFYQPDGSAGSCTLPNEEQKELIIDALRKIGAPLAARLCGDAQPMEPDEEVRQLAERHGIAVAASLELELALALYILENRDAFENPWRHTETAPRIRHKRRRE